MKLMHKTKVYELCFLLLLLMSLLVLLLLLVWLLSIDLLSLPDVIVNNILLMLCVCFGLSNLLVLGFFGVFFPSLIKYH